MQGTSMVKDACVIGAGPSGLAVCKAFHGAGLTFDCFEAAGAVGGVWNAADGASAAYESMHTNTSKRAMAFSDFPLPDDYPDFPHHRLVFDYLNAYVDRFGFREHLHFAARVQSVQRDGTGSWRVSLGATPQTAAPVSVQYRAIVVCTGQFNHPRLPSIPKLEEFTGQTLHTFDYKSPTVPISLRDKRVVILGLGASAIDIALELAEEGQARRVCLAARSGRYLAPKHFRGRPLDAKSPRPWEPLPRIAQLAPALGTWVARRMIERFFRTIGREYCSAESLGFPKPTYRAWEKPPSIAKDIRPAIQRGGLQVKPGIRTVSGSDIVFQDGTREPADVLILATGYRWAFPFLARELAAVGQNADEGERLSLYQRIAHPEIDSLYFVGYCVPTCSILPLAEQQACWLTDWLRRPDARPHASQMRKNLRLISRPLGTICNFYTAELREERQRLQRASARAGAPVMTGKPAPARSS